MKRSEIQSKACSAKTDLKERIESAPVQAVGVGVLVGLMFGVFGGLLFPLLFIVAAGITVMWFVAEDEVKE